MKQVLLFTLMLLTGFFPSHAMVSAETADVTGYWFMRDVGSKRHIGIIYIYEYKGKIYGRTMVAFHPKTGEVFSYVDEGIDTAKYLIGSPKELGLDVLWGLEWDENRGRYVNGHIMDPSKRSPYGAQIWRVGNTLKMRGSLGPFGGAVDWERASASDLPAGVPSFKPSELVPIIHYDERGRIVAPHNP